MAVSKIGMRKAWFQVHKWIGLLLAIAIIPICFTGAALVWKDTLDRTVNPARFATSGAEATRPVSEYAAAATNALAPGERVLSVRFSEDAGPVIVTAAQPAKPGAGGRPVRTMVWLDPGTAQVLDKATSSEGVVRVFHVIHGSLMLPGVGRKIVGWIGVAMLISSISGIWLWWPTVGKWVRGLRWRRHNNLDTNLHHMMGFWISVPLFILSFTGVWISFPPFFAKLSGAQTQQKQGTEKKGAEKKGEGPGRMAAQPLETTTQGVDGAVTAAVDQVAGTPMLVTWPTDQKAEWEVSLKPAEGAVASVTVDDVTGEAKLEKARPERGGIARTMRRIHDGNGTGALWQTIVFLGGLLPTILAITGVIMWWRARSWRGKLKQRQVAATARQRA